MHDYVHSQVNEAEVHLNGVSDANGNGYVAGGDEGDLMDGIDDADLMGMDG